jgi:cytoskeletal protein RodZ
MEDGVTVGEALAQARGAAGLSVYEVSERTGIRETVIRDIERDDFDALGGDLYVRGYLRAIAGAIGLDPQQLIREFDAARSVSGTWPATAAPGLAAGVTATGAGLAGAGPAVAGGGPGTGLAAEPAVEASEDYLSSWWADDAVSDADPLPVTQAVAEAPWPDATQPAHPPQPGHAAQPASTAARPARRPRASRAGTAPRSRVRGRRWVTTISVLTAVVLGIVGVAAAQIVARLHSPGHASASTAGATPTVQPAAVRGTSAGPAPSPPASAMPAATKSAAVTPSEPKATPEPLPTVRLTVLEASAFGPDGVADGDNPQDAGYVINPDTSLPWHTDWYATAEFGQLKHGTGLLLDMGQTVTVTSVRIRLGDISGADLQVRAGAVASLGAAPVLASAQDAGGALALQLKAPARARYVIIWFTGLPPNGAGKYQASVYSVAVTGRP